MAEYLGELVARYGEVLVAVLLFIEGIGIPIPGESALMTAAALAGRGAMSIFGVAIAAAFGSFAGTAAGYWIGRRGGPAIVARYGALLRLDQGRLERAQAFFAKNGGKTLVLGRFVAFVRSFIGIFAGISGMPLRQFLVYNVAGGVVWAGTFSVLGYAFGRNLPRLIKYIGRVSLLVAILIALVAGLVFVWRWFNANRTAIVAAMSRPRYLVAHLAVGFLVGLGTIAVFGSITEDIVEGSPLTRFDVVVATRLHESAGAGVLALQRVISGFGSHGAMTLLLIGGAAYLVVRRRGAELAIWCAAFIGGSLLDAALSFVVRRSQLPFADVETANWTSGLASGHVLGVVVGYGMVAHLLIPQLRSRTARVAVVVAAIALPAAIAVSRLYLGLHYVSDESAGIAAGLLWATACISASEIARQLHKPAG
jgi:membrane protein DedA with SNARE-associated domain